MSINLIMMLAFSMLNMNPSTENPMNYDAAAGGVTFQLINTAGDVIEHKGNNGKTPLKLSASELKKTPIIQLQIIAPVENYPCVLSINKMTYTHMPFSGNATFATVKEFKEKLETILNNAMPGDKIIISDIQASCKSALVTVAPLSIEVTN